MKWFHTIHFEIQIRGRVIFFNVRGDPITGLDLLPDLRSLLDFRVLDTAGIAKYSSISNNSSALEIHGPSRGTMNEAVVSVHYME